LLIVIEDNNPVVAPVCQVVLKMNLAANGADGPPLLPFGLAQLQRPVKSLENNRDQKQNWQSLI
jgi:hypothetical protein